MEIGPLARQPGTAPPVSTASLTALIFFAMTFPKAQSGECGAPTASEAVDKLVLATVNAPYKREISASILAGCLAQADPGNWTVHVATFFSDLSPELIFDFAASHGISNSKLADAYMAVKSKTGEFTPDLEAKLASLATVAP
jgi:hypothetical protein